MFQTFKKCFKTGNDTGISGMLIKLQLQAGFFTHYVLEKRQEERIRPTVEVRKINRKKPGVVFDYLSGP